MKKIYFLLFLQSLIFNLTSSFGQGGTWTWVSGDSAQDALGVYGTQGVPSVNNHPPALYEPVEWKDKQGNFWIYGGSDNYSNGWSDLWKYHLGTNEWTWVMGTGSSNQLPVYGIQGIANSSNSPGARSLASATWVDTSGTFWLFGGSPAANGADYYNDLWKYNIGNNEWTWVNGADTTDTYGFHGIQGLPGASPGARGETCSAWADSLNNLWLFGGIGFDDSGIGIGFLSDLMKYDISNNEWTWMKGSAYANAVANFGIEGVGNTNNDPGARLSYTKWKDVQGNFWLMGGADLNFNFLSDVWIYNLNANEWMWMGGSNSINDTGNYQSNCVFDTNNLPSCRFEQRASVTDNCGNFWLFGGYNYSQGSLNDLWVFDPQELNWNLVGGAIVGNQSGSYGRLGEPSPSNIPPSRLGADAWWGNDNKFYVFGGSTYIGNISDLWVFTPDTSCVPICGAIALVSPVADFQVSQAAICANACINFTDLSTNATSWQWSFSGALDSTSTTQNPQNICYSKAGIYNVTLVASNGAGSDTVTFSNYITVIPTPPTPVITQHYDTLYCSFDTSYYAYQWFLDSALISGATDTFLVISKSGNYNVLVTSKNGCTIAGGINLVLGVENYSTDNNISIYPNPVSDKFTVCCEEQSNLLQGAKQSLIIYNVLGQVCNQSEIVNRQSEIVIDVSDLTSGIYFVQIIGDNERWVEQFVKE